jgi:uncharacterized protein
MILNFSIKNFYSFKEENTVSFIVNKKAPSTDAYITTKRGERVTKILVCFGKNASGKTNLLKALPFLRWFIRKSFNLKPEEKIPIKNFLFEKEGTKIIALSTDFYSNGKTYRYSLQLTPEQVINESLNIRDGKGFKYLFKRIWNEKEKRFTFSTKNFGLSSSFGEVIQLRKNASVLSIALQYNHEESKNISKYWSTLQTNVREQGREGHLGDAEAVVQMINSAEYFYRNKEYKTKAEKFLTHFDLGLSGIEIEQREVGIEKDGKAEKLIFPYGVHLGRDKSRHRLPLFYESSGTQNLFILLRQILPILESKDGGIAVLDEFEADLHPHMIPALLELFISKKSNPHDAQLLVSCHSIELMRKLDKYQILLVDRNDGYSQVTRMDELKGVRSDDNFFAKYDAGAYRAVPDI